MGAGELAFFHLAGSFICKVRGCSIGFHRDGFIPLWGLLCAFLPLSLVSNEHFPLYILREPPVASCAVLAQT